MGIIYYYIIDLLHKNLKIAKNININFSFNSYVIGIILFEIFENNPEIINKYASIPNFSSYSGDSIANIIGDIYVGVIGYYFSYKNKKYSIICLILSEIISFKYRIGLFSLNSWKLTIYAFIFIISLYILILNIYNIIYGNCR